MYTYIPLTGSIYHAQASRGSRRVIGLVRVLEEKRVERKRYSFIRYRCVKLATGEELWLRASELHECEETTTPAVEELPMPPMADVTEEVDEELEALVVEDRHKKWK